MLERFICEENALISKLWKSRKELYDYRRHIKKVAKDLEPMSNKFGGINQFKEEFFYALHNQYLETAYELDHIENELRERGEYRSKRRPTKLLWDKEAMSDHFQTLTVKVKPKQKNKCAEAD